MSKRMQATPLVEALMEARMMTSPVVLRDMQSQERMMQVMYRAEAERCWMRAQALTLMTSHSHLQTVLVALMASLGTRRLQKAIPRPTEEEWTMLLRMKA